MLHSISFLATTIVGYLSLTTALPATSNPPAKVTINGTSDSTCRVLLCTDVNSGGDCVDVTGPNAQCVAASEVGSEYVSSVSTFRIEDGCNCVLTDNPYCYRNGDWIFLGDSGSSDLDGEGFNDMMQSYICNH